MSVQKNLLNILSLACWVVLFAACSKEDNNSGTPTPQDSWTAEEKLFVSQVTGIWTDFDENQAELSASYVIYDIQDDGDIEMYKMVEDGNKNDKGEVGR